MRRSPEPSPSATLISISRTPVASAAGPGPRAPLERSITAVSLPVLPVIVTVSVFSTVAPPAHGTLLSVSAAPLVDTVAVSFTFKVTVMVTPPDAHVAAPALAGTTSVVARTTTRARQRLITRCHRATMGSVSGPTTGILEMTA